MGAGNSSILPKTTMNTRVIMNTSSFNNVKRTNMNKIKFHRNFNKTKKAIIGNNNTYVKPVNNKSKQYYSIVTGLYDIYKYFRLDSPHYYSELPYNDRLYFLFIGGSFGSSPYDKLLYNTIYYRGSLINIHVLMNIIDRLYNYEMIQLNKLDNSSSHKRTRIADLQQCFKFVIKTIFDEYIRNGKMQDIRVSKELTDLLFDDRIQHPLLPVFNHRNTVTLNHNLYIEALNEYLIFDIYYKSFIISDKWKKRRHAIIGSAIMSN